MKRMRYGLLSALLAALFVATAPAQAALAANCSGTSVGLAPLPDLGSGTYQGVQGGLYPGGTNEAPAAYAAAGERAANAIAPRDQNGRPDENGKIALLSIGMSNTTQEFSAFIGLSMQDALRDPHVAVVDGAQGGQDAKAWVDPNANTWTVVEQRLRAAGITDAQVQVIWLKQAQASPTSDFATYTKSLAGQLRAIVNDAAKRFPNLRQVFVSPRTYAGYATSGLNPEPYAYWSGFADRLLVTESVNDPSARPWIGWGAFLWTDGTRGRSDGFTWTCADVQSSDGTHPSDAGRQKVARLLQTFFDSNAFAGWYRGGSAATASPPAPLAGPSVPQPSLPQGGLPVALLTFAGGIAAAFAAYRLARGRP